MAPTPSGYLHEGNLFNFFITQDLAARCGASLALRIDDLDRARFRREYLKDIFNKLDLASITVDQGPSDANAFLQEYSQELRTKSYEEALDLLKSTGRVFACSCSRKQIASASANGTYPGTCRDKGISLDTADHALRFRIEPGDAVVLKTLFDEEQHLVYEHRIDPVVRRRDGIVAYDLASVVDDIELGIDLIVRGQDLFGSSVFQLLLARFLQNEEFQKVRFVHHDLVQSELGDKLSKSISGQAERRIDFDASRTSAKALVDSLLIG